jgi:cobalt/nickel transport system permease protein
MSRAAGLDWASSDRDAFARLDPRTRLLSALALIVTIAMLKPMPALIAALALAVLLAALARLDLHATLHRLLHLEGFMLVVLLLLPLTVPGTPFVQVGPLTASAEGVARAFAIILKANAAVLIVLALVAPPGTVRIGHALARLGVPDVFVQVFLFTVRYVDLFAEERARLSTAMRVRGFVPRLDRHTFVTYGRLVGALVLRSLDRADRVHAAMRLRGFTGRVHRHETLAFAPIDALAALACLALVLLLLMIGWAA